MLSTVFYVDSINHERLNESITSGFTFVDSLVNLIIDVYVCVLYVSALYSTSLLIKLFLCSL